MKSRRKRSAQEIQDTIFRKMPVAKKIALASALAMCCLKLNRLNYGNHKSRKVAS